MMDDHIIADLAESVRESGLIVEVHDGVARLTLSRPGRGNSLTAALIDSILLVFKALQQRRDIKVVVLSGTGKTFCGGADLQNAQVLQFQHIVSEAPFANLMRGFRALSIPLVARVNGSAAGGGVGLLGMCDFVVSVDTARFGITEIDVGFFPSMVLVALRNRISHQNLTAMCMLGEKIDTTQAFDIGLITHVASADRLDAVVDGIVQQLASKPISAMRRGKYMLREMESMTFEGALAFTETVLRVQGQDPAAEEGLAAFREKRAPIWP